jgi:hypothetical protein
MKLKIRMYWSGAASAGLLLISSFAAAQQLNWAIPQKNSTYDLTKETVLRGKVITYSPVSNLPPIGAHVSVQTSLGLVDVHVGSAQLLQQKQFTLAPGDSIQITGEMVSYGQGSMFAARIIENGRQSVTVRNTKGQVLQMPAAHMPRGAR